MTAYGIGYECMGSKTANGLKVEMEHVTAIRVWMNNKFTYGNGSSTALGTKLIETLSTGTRTAISGYVCCTHRCGKDTITESHLT
jgi:hypothetical protein